MERCDVCACILDDEGWCPQCEPHPAECSDAIEELEFQQSLSDMRKALALGYRL